jgi:hypothetical protein
MPWDFRHVTDELVRHVLYTHPQQLRTFEVEQAVDRTILALGFDASGRTCQPTLRGSAGRSEGSLCQDQAQAEDASLAGSASVLADMRGERSQFRRVANLLLRHVLESRPEDVHMVEIERAVGWTLDQLGRDAVRIDIPAREFSRRRIEARKALVLRRQHRKAQAHRALQRFWD